MEKEIIEFIQQNKGDRKLYLLTFNILTDNNTLKNYSHNNNGIFFNINTLNKEKIKLLNDEIKKFLENKKNISLEDENRKKTMEEMKDSLSPCFKSQLKAILNQKNGVYSTEIEQENENKVEDEKIKQKRMKKSIDEFLKPVSFKNSHARINKIINTTSSTRHRRGLEKITKESDNLYSDQIPEENEIEEEDLEEDLEEELETPEDEEIDEEDLFGEKESEKDF